jgi:hypothetical protein
MVGEAWSVLAGTGNAFRYGWHILIISSFDNFVRDYNNPQVVFKVGDTGSTGTVEITDILFSTIGPGKVLCIA